MFAELVCGPPGSGKTTYCEGKRQFLSVYDPSRPVITFNLDPANDGIFPYPCDINICELVEHQVVMETEALGPNGSYLYCSEFIQENIEWVRNQIARFVDLRVEETNTAFPAGPRRAPYLLIDCPGQVEFYLNSTFMQQFIQMLQKRLRCDVCAVHLTDSIIATRDVSTYIATCLLSLSTMVDMELPHVNVLTKWETLPPFKVPAKDKRFRKHPDLKGPHGEALPASSDSSDDVDADYTSEGRYAGKSEVYEHFLQPTEFFEYHMRRLWRIMDKGTYRHVVGTASKTSGKDTEGVVDATGGRHRYMKTPLYRLSHAIMEVVEGYGMVAFVPLDIQNQEMMLTLTQKIDNAMGNLV